MIIFFVVIIIIVIFIVLFNSTNKDKEVMSKIDIGTIWDECDRNIDKVVSRLHEEKNIDNQIIIEYLNDYFVGEIEIRKNLIKYDFNAELTVEKMYEETNYDKEIIKKEVYKRLNEFKMQKLKVAKQQSQIYSDDYHNTNKSKTPKQTYKQNKKQGVVSCPKCGSQSITATNKKLSVKRGAVGAIIGSAVNPVGTAVGAVAGGLSSKKMYNVCMNCGHRWKP